MGNPEVIVAHRPFANFHGKEHIDKVKTTLKMHRDTRGLLMDPESAKRRRPRSIIFSSDNTQAIAETADMIWELPEKVGGPCKQYDNADEVVRQMTEERM